MEDIEKMECAFQHLYTGYYSDIYKPCEELKRSLEAEVGKLKSLIEKELRKHKMTSRRKPF